MGAAVLAGYVVTAQLGFRFAFTAEQVTTVWAPTGLAQAALLLWGRHLWPAVWLGAFTVNAGMDAPLWTAPVIATGNTLEALAAATLLGRASRFDAGLSHIHDVILFIAFAALTAPAISATIGVGTLWAAGLQPAHLFGALWTEWWIGDAVGALVVAPALLTTMRPVAPWSRRRLAELAFILVGIVLAAHLSQAEPFVTEVALHPIEFVMFPFIVVTAVRLRQPATALAILTAAVVTVWSAAAGFGPMADATVRHILLLLQAFTGVLAGTGLLLAAAMEERHVGDQRRAAAHAVSEVLANAPSLTTAAPALLHALGRTLGWPFGALWIVDRERQQMRCTALWDTLGASGREFVRATERVVFARGAGLPGRVWAQARPVWIEDVRQDDRFVRLSAADRGRLHSAFAFPLVVGDDVLGVVEFFHRRTIRPDTDLLETLATVGLQIGQFIYRVRAAEVLAEEQRRTRAVLNTALDAVIGMDHEGRITSFNPAAERMFGHAADAALGRLLVDLLIPLALRTPHREGLARYLATGEERVMNRRLETTALHADGHEFPVELAITRLPSEDPPQFTGFVRDLTERVRAERDRERLLEREATARREAEAANRAKDEFLATLSHELRTPLNAIVGWTRILQDGAPGAASLQRALDVIDRNAMHQARLIEDILDVSRIITGGLHLDVRPVDLGTVIGAALDAVRPAATAKQVAINAQLESGARLTEGDPQRLQQVVWNLLSNAVKFTPRGGLVRIALSDADEHRVRIVVEDNGAGIDPRFLPHVFERFRQADSSSSRQYGGLGLGLAIVRHLVELHGGTVAAESGGLDQGARFTVELPRMRPAEDAEAGGPARGALDLAPASNGALNGCHVLVVEDDTDGRELMATVLQMAGARVDTAASVREAREHLERRWPDVLLADIGMPGEDGYSLIGAVRHAEREGGRRRLPAAAITAYAGVQDRERAWRAGFDRHLAKPIDPALLVTLVESLRRS